MSATEAGIEVGKITADELDVERDSDGFRLFQVERIIKGQGIQNSVLERACCVSLAKAKLIVGLIKHAKATAEARGPQMLACDQGSPDLMWARIERERSARQ
jgi:hypothetical protein